MVMFWDKLAIFLSLHFFFFFILFFRKLHTHPVSLESMTSPSTLLQKEEVPFELKLIGALSRRVLTLLLVLS